MKKLLYITISMVLVSSCSSIEKFNQYLNDKNIVSFKDDVKYKEIKDNKVETKKTVETKKSVEVKKEPVKENKTIKVAEEKVAVKKEESTVKNDVKKTNEVKEVKSTTVVKNTENKKEVEKPKEVIKKVEEVVAENKNSVNNNNNVNTVKFEATDEKIIDFIAEKVVESRSQIKQKTAESILKLREKGYNYTPKEFLAKAYENIKLTNVNSFLLATARVMNNIERGKK